MSTWAKATEFTTGAYKRQERTFRSWIKKDGEFPPEKDRYHLYVSYACPWACRTLTVRKLKGLEDVISVNIVDTFLEKEVGWTLMEKDEGSTPDTVNGFKHLKEIYYKADPNYDQSFTVPVLWDKKKSTIVNNESSEIIRMLNAEFNDLAKNPQLDLYPEALRPKIDEVNAWVYDGINNGVYKCGFAQKQEAFDQAYANLFSAMDRVEDILSSSRYLAGNQFTEADVRLFQTLIRHDLVYHTHFKCNKARIVDYPNMWEYVKEIYQMPGIKDVVNFDHIKKHYYASHRHINPFGIIPSGPTLHLEVPHKRGQ
eukprot:TRINITY_DN3545_c1_g1_i1.p1 TRINITY_DN3545_c1_g1~~TRINITY_DN3545_c1_g1_i1.p1  ORF type:complete len:312 (+),score=107.93 TRINITY_DN3545_c1_g1_i1:70-1005(+)